MYTDATLKAHLESSSSLKIRSLVCAEWNLNTAQNILEIGNYRFRPTVASPTEANFGVVQDDWALETSASSPKYYYGATDADVVLNSGYSDTSTPAVFATTDEKRKQLFSLEDCLNRFRPRSGINKLVYFADDWINHTHPEMAKRPRYYLADKNDKFKYWTSFRTETSGSTTVERGISKTSGGEHFIDDAAPFVVYRNAVSANRIVVKMQSHIGSIDLGTFKDGYRSFSDPFYGSTNKATPLKWKIQYLDPATSKWTTATNFTTDVVTYNGYVELAYGLTNIPGSYTTNFVYAGEYSSSDLLPTTSVTGYAYLVKTSSTDIGQYYVWNGLSYDAPFTPTYGWYKYDESVNRTTPYVTELVDTKSYSSGGTTYYREFQNIKGVRVVVETMNKADSTFDLIEISPRLAIDLTEKTENYSIKKDASDIGTSGLPVGRLLAGTGSITLFDYDQAFNIYNSSSIIKSLSTQNLQIKFYEIVLDVNGYDYYIPQKVLYAEGFPDINNQTRAVTIRLRDLYFYFESLTAPQILLEDVSLSYAASVLLDSVGFSNYSFLKVPKVDADGNTITENGNTVYEDDPIIPYFFIGPETTVAEVLNELAISTQTAIFFDESNNLIFMSKNYMMPTSTQRSTNATLYGSIDFAESGAIENSSTNPSNLSNIMDIKAQVADVYNDGKIMYSSKYIQKSYGSLKQSYLVDSERTWQYKPVLLWEIAPEQNTKSVNDELSTASAYSLSAIPLNTELSATLPTVSSGEVINNIIDFGEGIYWISRYKGYFYANGEIIRYDAVEYNVPVYGNVWIKSVEEYQNYFSKLTFGGKIYPTGRVRIFTEPQYDSNGDIVNGSVVKHGRGQFGTSVVSHPAGLSADWASNTYVKGCKMKSKFLFYGTTLPEVVPATTNALAGQNNAVAQKSTRNGIIKNVLSSEQLTETKVNSLKTTQVGSVQSSAFVFDGPSFSGTGTKPSDHISYVYKPLTREYAHLGTRLRIVGNYENSKDRFQTPVGSMSLANIESKQPSQNTLVAGASGGIAIGIDNATNAGYYFEVVALTENNVYNGFHNVLFYKIQKETGKTSTDPAIPLLLWRGQHQILVDDGKFTGQSRVTGEEYPTVYDLAIEHTKIGKKRVFNLFINNNLIASITDTSPINMVNNVALFVRGASRVMFENVYAITPNEAYNKQPKADTPFATVFDDGKLSSTSGTYSKYALGAGIQSTYVKSLSALQPPEYLIYYDEFGTIMRECSYFNIKYDKAYPALQAKIAPTFNKLQGYTISGFAADPYGAEFLIFNTTDTVLNLDSTTGNYLRILGVTFTQQSEHDLTVDEFFAKKSDFSNPTFSGDSLFDNPVNANNIYYDIKNSRMTYGKKEFNISGQYIQSQDAAEGLMDWIATKLMKPRRSVGIEVFGMPIIQLGDILEIDYQMPTSNTNSTEINQISADGSRFVVYSIEYNRNQDGPSTTIYLSEVV
jgi:hypothetical protein